MRTDVRIWMLRNGIQAVDAARELGVSRSTISHWLAGRRTSKRIEDYFVAKGCPERHVRNGKKREAA